MVRVATARRQLIQVADSAYQAIERFAAESADGRETGGILLGRGPDATGAVHVEVAGEPGPNAIRRADFFQRDLDHARKLADDAWEVSRAVWIGEWHTHLHAGPRPSAADLRTYARLLTAASLQFEVFAAVIVVPDSARGWHRPQLWPWLLHINAGMSGSARAAPSGPKNDS